MSDPTDPLALLLMRELMRPGVITHDTGTTHVDAAHLAAALRDAGLITRDEAADEVLAIGRYARTGPALNTARAAVEAAAEWVRAEADQ